MTNPDKELIAQMARGERSALSELYRRHSSWIAGRLAASTSSRDLAEEALQDTFVSAWRGAKSYRGEGDVGAWLWGIARRRLVSLSRKRTHVTIGLVDEQMPGADEIVLQHEEAWRVRAAVSRLPQDQRIAIESVVFADRTVAEVASTLGVPVGTLKSRLHRARLRIKAELET
jgi:RNA polymerase sigma-70 factor, ECF subfamily